MASIFVEQKLNKKRGSYPLWLNILTNCTHGRLIHELKKKTRQIWGIWKLRPVYSPETPNLGQNRWCFVPCDLEIWWMTLENNRAFLLCCFKLCAIFHSHWWIQTGVTVRKRPIWVKFDDFKSQVTLKFDVWPRTTIGHLFYATSSSMHHFVAIGEFKLDLQSGNAQFGSKSTIFRAVWPCNFTYDLENNRAPLLCYLKLCASFRSHRWFQTWVTVRKSPIWVKFDDF